MTQFPHDEFDDVAPYKADEVGKHRAPGAASSGGATRGGLKWIGLLAALVLVIGAIAWITSQFGDETGEPTAELDEEQDTEEAETGETEGEAEEEEGDAATGGNGEESEEDDDGDSADVDTDYNVIVYNYDGTEGVAGSARQQLEEAGFNVVDQDNWTQGWTTCGETSPVVVHPPAEEDLAEVIAEEFDAATCASDGWAASEIIAVAVGAESLP